jgi:hypothetical protein
MEWFAKGLPGDDARSASINGPSWIAYPANALFYASRNGCVILNDNPTLPVPGVGDVKREARFIAETTVAPELEQLKADLARPSKPWYRRFVDLATALPSIAGAFATMPKSLAIAKALAKATIILADIRDSQLEHEGIGKRGGFHYLLSIERLQHSDD